MQELLLQHEVLLWTNQLQNQDFLRRKTDCETSARTRLYIEEMGSLAPNVTPGTERNPERAANDCV